jgi:hypothetical protein
MQTLLDILDSLQAHHWVLVILCLISLCFCAAIIVALRRSRDPLIGAARRVQSGDKPDWLQGTALAVAVLGLFTWLNIRDARVIDQTIAEQQRIDAGYLPTDRARLNVNLNDCPPRTDGMTDQIVMTIATHADHGPVVTGCSRIGQRMYQTKPREQVRG